MSTKTYKRNDDQKAFVDAAVKAAQACYARVERYAADKRAELAERAKGIKHATAASPVCSS